MSTLLDLDKSAQVTGGNVTALGLQGRGVRPLMSYERFSYETSTFERAEVGALRALIARGIEHGCAVVGRVGQGVVRAQINWAGTCETPAVRHLRGVPIPLPGNRMPHGVRAYLVSVGNRCKQCDSCLGARSYVWAERARTEYRRSARTWHLSITASPFQHARFDARVAADARLSGAFELSQWGPAELFEKRARVMGRELTLWLKRVREAEYVRRTPVAWAQDQNLPSRTVGMSYLLVAEEHNGEGTSEAMRGRPHYHMLLHEHALHELVREDEIHVTKSGEWRIDDFAMVKRHWQLGHLTGKLCESDVQAGYLCKYLSKDMLWRVRASEAYGLEIDGTSPTPLGRVAN